MFDLDPNGHAYEPLPPYSPTPRDLWRRSSTRERILAVLLAIAMFVGLCIAVFVAYLIALPIIELAIDHGLPAMERVVDYYETALD
jgi:uncharacterized membrane protein